jgi:hypothetical protein
MNDFLNTISVHTFDGTYYDIPRTNIRTGRQLKDHLRPHLMCGFNNLKLIYCGKEVKNDDSIMAIDKIYVCVVAVACKHTV